MVKTSVEMIKTWKREIKIGYDQLKLVLSHFSKSTVYSNQ